MKLEIIRSEIEPDRKCLWLHTKNDNLVLETYGDAGWESVGDSADREVIRKEFYKKLEESRTSKITPVKVKFPKLTKNCSKEELLSVIEEFKRVLAEAGITKSE